MKKNAMIFKMSLMSLGIALNVVGALIASLFRIPIYLDSMGTILIAFLFGPKYAIVTGVCGSLLSGVTFDYYSLYYAPVQIMTALSASLIARSGLKGPLILLCGFPTALASSLVTALVFGGLTSSASTYLVILLNKTGLSLTMSVLFTQIISDCLDKGLAVFISQKVSQQMKGRMTIYAKIQ